MEKRGQNTRKGRRIVQIDHDMTLKMARELDGSLRIGCDGSKGFPVQAIKHSQARVRDSMARKRRTVQGLLSHPLRSSLRNEGHQSRSFRRTVDQTFKSKFRAFRHLQATTFRVRQKSAVQGEILAMSWQVHKLQDMMVKAGATQRRTIGRQQPLLSRCIFGT